MECHLENITVNYEVYGQGRPLILLPGWTMPATMHAFIMEPYLHERQGWQRIYIDPPGHGHTPGADWIISLDQMLDVLLAFIEEIIPGQRFALHGYSLGAYLARGTYVVFDRAGHFLEEKEPLIGPLLNEWLDRVEEATLTT